MLETVINLGNQMLSDFRDDDKKPNAYPLHMVRCIDCNFCQLTDTAPFDEMYTENYGFKSGTNEVIRADLKDIAEQGMRYAMQGFDDVVSEPSLRVLDIASNDGTLLSNYPEHFYRVGVDPITKLCKEAEYHADLIVNDFFPTPLQGKFDIITAISCFYDVEDPANFLGEMVKLMKDNGVLIIQQNYLLATLQNNAYDNVCLAKGELVTTIEGNKKIEDIKEGELVLTHTGKFRKVLKKFVTPNNDKEMIRLRAYGAGYDLNVTKNHPVYVQRGGKWSFIPAEEVKINDIVGKPVVNENPEYTGKVKINSNTGKISGYYLAEEKMKVWLESGIQCMRVRKIELLPYEEKSVYNLEVEEDNSYVTPAMTVHNCHEHIGYHTLMSMENLFDRFGLECVDVSTSMVNGGVLRTVCQKKGVGVPTKAVQAQRDIETAYGLNTQEPYTRFRENVEKTAHELKDLIDTINASGKKCYIYGASTRGGTIWQYVGLDVKDLPYAVERNPGKIGKKIAAIGVPIISEEQARIDKPDFMLVSIWFFWDQTCLREADYLKSGAHLIRPLPTLEVI